MPGFNNLGMNPHFVNIQTIRSTSGFPRLSSNILGIKQLIAGGGVALIGITLVPLLSGLFG